MRPHVLLHGRRSDEDAPPRGVEGVRVLPFLTFALGLVAPAPIARAQIPPAAPPAPSSAPSSPPVPAPMADAPAAWVLRVDGIWLRGAGPKAVPIAVGAALRVGEPIGRGTPSRLSDRVVLVLSDGARHECRGTDSVCVAPAPRAAPSTTGSVARVVELVMSTLAELRDQWRSEPARPVSLISRGEAEGSAPHDAVVAVRGREVNLEASLADSPRGAYLLEVATPLRAAAADAARAIVVDWDPAHPQTGRVLDVAPGRYTLAASGGASEGAEVLVLVEGTHAQAARTFAEAVAVTRAWGPATPDRDVRAFQRAALRVLAERVR